MLTIQNIQVNETRCIQGRTLHEDGTSLKSTMYHACDLYCPESRTMKSQSRSSSCRTFKLSHAYLYQLRIQNESRERFFAIKIFTCHYIEIHSNIIIAREQRLIGTEKSGKKGKETRSNLNRDVPATARLN